MFNQHNRWTSCFVLILGIAVFMFFAKTIAPYSPDDAFISYRYAENLANGYGLTFNPGEGPVEGYSNLLWILLCSLFYKFGFNLPYFVPRMGVIFGILNIGILWLICRRRNFPPMQILFPLLLFSCSGPFTLYAISGMEAPLFSFLLLATMLCVDYLFSSGKLFYYIAVSFTCVLLALSRPEGVISFPIIAVYLLYLAWKNKKDKLNYFHKKRNLLISSAVFILLLVIYNFWRVQYFNEFLPTPFLSKGGGGGSLLDAWSINKSIYFSRQGYDTPPYGYYYLALTLLSITGLSLSNSKDALKHMECLSIIMGVVYVFVYLNFVDWMPGMRYHSALIGLFLLPTFHIQNSLFSKPVTKKQTAKFLQFAAIGMAVIAVSLFGMAQLRITAKNTEDTTIKTAMALADWLKDVMPSDSLIATSDVGIVPYYSNLLTLDIHPKSLTDLHIAKNGFSKEYFFKRDPDVVMLHSRGIFKARFRRGYNDLVNDPLFSNSYRFLGVSRFRWVCDRGYWIYIRKNLQVNDEQMERFPFGIGSIRRKSR